MTAVVANLAIRRQWSRSVDGPALVADREATMDMLTEWQDPAPTLPDDIQWPTAAWLLGIKIQKLPYVAPSGAKASHKKLRFESTIEYDDQGRERYRPAAFLTSDVGALFRTVALSDEARRELAQLRGRIESRYPQWWALPNGDDELHVGAMEDAMIFALDVRRGGPTAAHTSNIQRTTRGWCHALWFARFGQEPHVGLVAHALSTPPVKTPGGTLTGVGRLVWMLEDANSLGLYAEDGCPRALSAEEYAILAIAGGWWAPAWSKLADAEEVLDRAANAVSKQLERHRRDTCVRIGDPTAYVAAIPRGPRDARKKIEPTQSEDADSPHLVVKEA